MDGAPDSAPGAAIRPYRHGEDAIPAITALLHDAYAEWAAQGFHFVASWQDDVITEKRLTGGHAFLMEMGDRLIGTITAYPPRPQSPCPWYRQAGVWSFGQLAVAPEFRGQGHAERLIAHCEAMARAHGAREMALDTCEDLAPLIRYYTRLGYRIVDFMDWDATNYRSVVMAKGLRSSG